MEEAGSELGWRKVRIPVLLMEMLANDVVPERERLGVEDSSSAAQLLRGWPSQYQSNHAVCRFE